MTMRLTILLLTVPAIAWAMQLPPDMEADRFLLQAESAIEEQDFEQAKTTMDRILELQASMTSSFRSNSRFDTPRCWSGSGSMTTRWRPRHAI